jgi:betaine-aldehyde dehydrogenase/succinate-semialdehyde dehydrogenase/glutarate-semialdehyde dehydrogenase
VDKISFTGSTVVGRQIAAEAGPLFKRLTLELGGKAPQIILEDAVLEQAIGGCAMGLFVDQGQTCAAGSRILVHRSRYDDVLQALAGAARSLQLGDPFNPATQMGARSASAMRSGCGPTSRPPARPARRCWPVTRVPARLLRAAHHLRRRHARHGHRPRGGLRPGRCGDPFRQRRRGRGPGQRQRLRSVGHPVDAEPDQGPQPGRAPEGGAVAINGWSPLDARLPWGGGKDSGVGRDLSRAALDGYLEEKVVTVVM